MAKTKIPPGPGRKPTRGEVSNRATPNTAIARRYVGLRPSAYQRSFNFIMAMWYPCVASARHCARFLGRIARPCVRTRHGAGIRRMHFRVFLSMPRFRFAPVAHKSESRSGACSGSGIQFPRNCIRESRNGETKNSTLIASIDIDPAIARIGWRMRSSRGAGLKIIIQPDYRLQLSRCLADMVNDNPGLASV